MNLISSKTRIFIASFAIAAIIIASICGFIAVDLSTDRYMPNQFGPFFEITSIKSGEVEFTLMAQDYILDTTIPAPVQSQLHKYRGLLSPVPRVSCAVAEQLMFYALEQLDMWQQKQEQLD